MTDLFPALVLDTETTGFVDYRAPADDPVQPRMAALAAVLIDEAGNALADMDYMVRPDGWEMPPELPEKLGNGLTQERLEAEGQPVEAVLNTFITLFGAAKIIVAYGIAFDMKVLRGELRRAGMNDLYGAKPDFCVLHGATRQCKVEQKARGLTPINKTAKLSESCEILLGRPHENAHTAMGDVITTVDLYRHLAAAGVVTPKLRQSTR